MVKIIATDLDGTLFKPKKKYSFVDKENKQFIQSFYGNIVLVTGRGPKFCAKICNKLKIEHHFIAFNGAVIVKNGNVIYRQSMKKTPLNNLVDFLEEYYSNFELLIYDKYDEITCYSPTKKSVLLKKYFKSKLINGKLQEKICYSNKKAKRYLNDNTEIHKILIYTDNIKEDMFTLIQEKFKNHFTFFYKKNAIEIVPVGINKGKALQYLISTNNIEEKDVFVVGDGPNDIPMFELFENSFAMIPCDNRLKLLAKHTINKFSDLKEYTKLDNNLH